MNRGKPVELKIPKDDKVEWLISCLADEEYLVRESRSLDLAMDWDIVEVQNPKQYPNCELFFAGHLDSDKIGTGGLFTLSDIEEMKK